MEVLKTVLRRSIRKKAWQVTLAVGQPARIENDRGSDEIDLDQPIDESSLLGVFRFLFPKDFEKLESKKPVQGALKVPNIGTINVVAQYPHTLHLFIPPDGNEKFNLFWDEITAVSSADLTGANMLPNMLPSDVATPNAEVPRAPVSESPREPRDATPPAPISNTGPVAPPESVVDVSQSFAGGLGANTRTGIKAIPTESKAEAPAPRVLPTDKELPEPDTDFTPALAATPASPPSSTPQPPITAGVSDLHVDPNQTAPVHDFDPNVSIRIKAKDEPFSDVSSREIDVSQPEPKPVPLEPISEKNPEPDLGMAFVPAEAAIPDLSNEPEPFPDGSTDTIANNHGTPSGDTMAELPGMPDEPVAADLNGEASANSFDFSIATPPTDGISTPQESVGVSIPSPNSRVGQGSPAAPGTPLKVNFGVDTEREGYLSEGINSVDEILRQMIGKGASDVHLTTGLPVSMRVDGDIIRLDSPPISEHTMENYILPITPAFNLDEVLRTNDTDFAYEIRDVGRFRVNVFRDRMGISAVLRHIPSEVKPASELGLPKAVFELTKLNKGLVLVTGPTGSGKSTSLAAMVNEINRSRSQHIITIEDPIEFIHPQLKCLVHQREVHRHTQSFSRALRAALREDPDVLLIGELRDLETIGTAIETAETGHLVMGTLHTNSATSTVDRMIDMFPAEQQEQVRQMLASSLKGVITQTLVKRKGGGRVPAFEVLMVNDAAAAMIREGKTHMLANHMQTQKAAGNVLMNDSLMQLVKNDIVNPLEAYSRAADKKAFGDQLRRAGFHIKFEGGSSSAPANAGPTGQRRPANYRAG